jgi:hypothetical protein
MPTLLFLIEHQGIIFPMQGLHYGNTFPLMNHVA